MTEEQSNSKNRKNLSLALGVVIALVVLFFCYQFSRQQAILEEPFESFYLDSQELWLDSKITQEDINNLATKIEGARDEDQARHESGLRLIQQKFQIYQFLDQVYQEDDLSQQVRDNQTLSFKSNIPFQLLNELPSQVEWVSEDVETQSLDQQIQELHHDSHSLWSLKEELIELLSLDYEPEGTLQTTMPRILEIEEELKQVEEHPQAQVLEDSLTGLGDQIVAGLDEYYSKPDVLCLFDWDKTRVKVIDTEFDYRPLVALTFDDVPHPEHTRPILEVLDKHKIRGTFFLLGTNAERHPEIVNEIVDAGHLIGNHSYNHPNFAELSDAQVAYQMDITNQIIEGITGETPHLFRTPYGIDSSRTQRLYPNQSSILWNVDSMDWHYQDVLATFEHTVQQVEGDVIILFHDRLPGSDETLDLVIQELKDRHYKFVAPTEIPIF